MQVIDILRDNRYIEVLFKLGQTKMSGIGISLTYIPATHIVKIKHQSRVLPPASWGSHLRYLISFPKPIAVPESSQSAFRTNTCARQYHQFFHTRKIYKMC